MRTWPHKFPKSMRPEPKPERLFKFGSGKDTVWVRLMFDSIGPNTTMVKVMDFNRKIKKMASTIFGHHRLIPMKRVGPEV